MMRGMGHVRDVLVELFMVPFNKRKKRFCEWLFFMLIVSELVMGEAVGHTVGLLE